MVNIVENKRVMFCFKEINELHHILIKSFLNSGFDVIISAGEDEILDKSFLFTVGGVSNSPSVYNCDFDDEGSVQDLQSKLFDSHYPIDLVLTDFSQPTLNVGTAGNSYEELRGKVENGFNSYFHLLKCLFPLMNSKNSHIYHLIERAEVEKEKESGIQIMSNIASTSIFQMLMEENGDPKINLKELNLSLFWDIISSKQFSLESKRSSVDLLEFLEKNSFVR